MKGRIMPRRLPLAAANPHAAPVVIAMDGIAVGLALHDKHRFRFFSGHPRFDLLDGSRFTRIEDLRWAVKRLASATADIAGQPPLRAETRELAAM
jgi:hypothetical protein